MVGPVMRALARHVATSAVDGAALELRRSISAEPVWQPLALERTSSTRTPSSADGGLSSLSSPLARPFDSSGTLCSSGEPTEGTDSVMGDESDMLEHIRFDPLAAVWGPLPIHRDMQRFNEARLASDTDFDFDDGFALPPPALGLEEVGMALDTDDIENMDMDRLAEQKALLGDVCKVGPVESSPPALAPAPKVQKETRAAIATVATVATLRDLVRLEQRASFAAMMEHWANPARRDALRRRGAVRVGRQRVALRQRPTPPTSRRCAHCSAR